MIQTTTERLTIIEPTTNLTAIAMAEGGVALRINGESAYLDAVEVSALKAWLVQVSR